MNQRTKTKLIKEARQLLKQFSIDTSKYDAEADDQDRYTAFIKFKHRETGARIEFYQVHHDKGKMVEWMIDISLL